MSFISEREPRRSRARSWLQSDDLQAIARPLPWLFAIFALFYAAQLVTFRIPVDAEIAALRGGDARIWITQGRWGIYLLERYVLTQPTLPFLPLASFGLLMAVGYVFFLRAHGIFRLEFRHYAAFWVFVAFPVWFLLVEFPANTPAAGLGVASTGLSLLAFAKAMEARRRGAWGWEQWGWLAVQTILLMLAASLYQSLLLMVAIGGLGAIVAAALRGELRAPGMVVEALLLAVPAVAGFVLYFASWKLWLFALHLEPDYVTDFIRPHMLLSDPIGVVRTTMWQIRQIYQGGERTYGIDCLSFGLLPAVGILALLTAPSLRGQPWTRLLTLLFTGAVLALPFALNLMTGGTLPTRTLLAVPAALWFAVLLALDFAQLWLRRLTVVILAIAAAQALYVFALFQAADSIARQRDEQLAAAIYARIAEIRPDLSFGQPLKIDVFGGLSLSSPYPRVRESTIGASIFEWDGGNAIRIAALFRVLGYTGIAPASNPERAELLPFWDAMPLWPARGSVQQHGQFVLIKLGLLPGHVQEEVLLQRARTGAGQADAPGH